MGGLFLAAWRLVLKRAASDRLIVGAAFVTVLLAAALLGMTRAIGQQFAADWILLLTYALLIVTLIFRPEGLFNVRGRQA